MPEGLQSRISILKHCLMRLWNDINQLTFVFPFAETRSIKRMWRQLTERIHAATLAHWQSKSIYNWTEAHVCEQLAQSYYVERSGRDSFTFSRLWWYPQSLRLTILRLKQRIEENNSPVQPWNRRHQCKISQWSFRRLDNWRLLLLEPGWSCT